MSRRFGGVQYAHGSKELSPYLAKWGLLDKGFAYDVVAVFGSQSTGKSTLLNRLFGTSFDVMDESKRQQTTKGIWMCPSAYSSTLVMDVEGTDGRERGEDQDFERKSALFSLASTEVLIVNLWYVADVLSGQADPKGAPDWAIPGREHGLAEDGVRSQPRFVWGWRQRKAKVSLAVARCSTSG